MQAGYHVALSDGGNYEVAARRHPHVVAHLDGQRDADLEHEVEDARREELGATKRNEGSRWGAGAVKAQESKRAAPMASDGRST